MKQEKTQMNKASKNYYKDLKLSFPCKGKQETQLLHDISLRINELNVQNQHITYEELCDELGSPFEIVSDYFDNADSCYLAKKMRTSHYLRIFLIGLAILALILTGIYTLYLQKALDIVKESQIIYVEEYIE